jgi:hypothetical protein
VKKIPKKVKIGRELYTVELVDELPHHIEGCILYSQRVIRLAVKRVGFPPYKPTNAELWETLLHEVMHGALYGMSRHDLNNERFVDALCKRLYPTMKGM